MVMDAEYSFLCGDNRNDLNFRCGELVRIGAMNFCVLQV